MNHLKIAVIIGLIWLFGASSSSFAQLAIQKEEESVRNLSPLAKAFLDSNHVAVVRKHSNDSIEIEESLKFRQIQSTHGCRVIC